MAGDKRHFAVRGPKPGQYNLTGRSFAPSSQNQQVFQQTEASEVKSLERFLQLTNYKIIKFIEGRETQSRMQTAQGRGIK